MTVVSFVCILYTVLIDKKNQMRKSFQLQEDDVTFRLENYFKLFRVENHLQSMCIHTVVIVYEYKFTQTLLIIKWISF